MLVLMLMLALVCVCVIAYSAYSAYWETSRSKELKCIAPLVLECSRTDIMAHCLSNAFQFIVDASSSFHHSRLYAAGSLCLSRQLRRAPSLEDRARNISDRGEAKAHG